MEIIKYSDTLRVEDAIKQNEPLLAVIAFDGKSAVVSHVDEAVEHHILLEKAGLSSKDIDKYFRVLFDKEEANWTFVCPPDYKNISDKQNRVAQFYKDGFAAISDFLAEFGYFADINIPKRYRRHFDELKNS